MIYRRYAADDFPALYSIEERCFEPRFRFGRGYMMHLIKSSDSATWIAEEDGVMAGFAIVAWNRSARDDSGYLQTIEVLPEFRSRGIGEKLLSLAEVSVLTASSDTMSLHVDAANESAIRLYERCGYRRRGRKDNFYARGRSALFYVKQLEAVDERSLHSLRMGFSAA
ncbi:MAG TPA: N-acetyltransferase [Terracidiphilus sp.]